MFLLRYAIASHDHVVTRCYIELIHSYGVPHPPFSLLLLVSVVPPVGGLPGGLDEHASQGAASATCRQHAVMSQQSRSSTRAVNETLQKCSQYLDKAPTI